MTLTTDNDIEISPDPDGAKNSYKKNKIEQNMDKNKNWQHEKINNSIEQNKNIKSKNIK